MTEILAHYHFNNKGLKKLFPGTIVTRKKLVLGELDPKYLSSMIKSMPDIKYDYTSFQLLAIEDFEGEYNKWDLTLKLKLM